MPEKNNITNNNNDENKNIIKDNKVTEKKDFTESSQVNQGLKQTTSFSLQQNQNENCSSGPSNAQTVYSTSFPINKFCIYDQPHRKRYTSVDVNSINTEGQINITNSSESEKSCKNNIINLIQHQSINKGKKISKHIVPVDSKEIWNEVHSKNNIRNNYEPYLSHSTTTATTTTNANATIQCYENKKKQDSLIINNNDYKGI